MLLRGPRQLVRLRYLVQAGARGILNRSGSRDPPGDSPRRGAYRLVGGAPSSNASEDVGVRLGHGSACSPSAVYAGSPAPAPLFVPSQSPRRRLHWHNQENVKRGTTTTATTSPTTSTTTATSSTSVTTTVPTTTSTGRGGPLSAVGPGDEGDRRHGLAPWTTRSRAGGSVVPVVRTAARLTGSPSQDSEFGPRDEVNGRGTPGAAAESWRPAPGSRRITT